jgi:hypothetical protein
MGHNPVGRRLDLERQVDPFRRETRDGGLHRVRHARCRDLIQWHAGGRRNCSHTFGRDFVSQDGFLPAGEVARLCPDVGSIIWQAAMCDAVTAGASRGACALQTASANGHRVWKRQPGGGSIGFGGSPVIGGYCVRESGSSDGIAASSALV